MDWNKFFKLLSRNPGLMWRFIAPFIFIALALILYFVPSYGFGGNSSMRNTFAFLMTIYAGFRFYTFYTEYKRVQDDEERR